MVTFKNVRSLFISRTPNMRTRISKKKLNAKLLAIVGILSLMVLSELPASANASTARVNTPGSRLNCRATPGGTIVGKLTHNSTVSLTGKTSGVWRQVALSTRTCWASGQYLVVIANKPAAPVKQPVAPAKSVSLPCDQTRTYDMLLVIPKTFRLPDGKLVTGNQSHIDNSYALARHIEDAYKTYTKGCIDFKVTTTLSNTPVSDWLPNDGMPYIDRYQAKFTKTLPQGGTYDFFAFTTQPETIPTGAAGAQWGNAMWVESYPNFGYIADHEILHWIEGITGSKNPNAPQCPQHPGSWVHCSTSLGYKAESPAWFTDVFNARVGGNKGITRDMYRMLPL